jgi:two-component system chemotaxis response regulator CheB
MTPFSQPPMHRIRVLLVDDSPLSLELFRRMLATAPEILIVGTAINGTDALSKITELTPDVICTDLHMPGMDGVALTREVMHRHPLPILVVSTSLQKSQKDNIFAMLEAGAVDILAKPLGGLEMDFENMARDLIQKIKVLSGVKVFRRHTSAPGASRAPVLNSSTRTIELPRTLPQIVCIGSSTGGPQALEIILSALPRDFSLPIICIQHIAQGFMQGMVNWLAGNCRIRVAIAQSGVRPMPGTAYFPPDDRHLEIDHDGRFRFSALPAVGGHRPSVDLAMYSLAHYYWDGVAGILLTGMGQDGAQGLLEISRAGGFTIAQDESSSVVFGMPKCAIELGAARLVLPLPQIAGTLLRLSGTPSP